MLTPAESNKLEDAMTEVLEVLRKHDVAGSIKISLNGMGIHRLHLSTTWTNVAETDNHGSFRFMGDPHNGLKLIAGFADVARQELASLSDALIRLCTNYKIKINTLLRTARWCSNCRQVMDPIETQDGRTAAWKCSKCGYALINQ